MAKGRDFKKPHAKTTNRIQISDAEYPQNYDLLKPSFSFKFIRYLGQHCVSQCAEDKKALILSKLLKLSQSTWKDIRRMPREQGFEPIPENSFLVPVPRPPHITPEATILVTRYDGDGGRLAGFRDKDTYHVVLAGKDLYPH